MEGGGLGDGNAPGDAAAAGGASTGRDARALSAQLSAQMLPRQEDEETAHGAGAGGGQDVEQGDGAQGCAAAETGAPLSLGASADLKETDAPRLRSFSPLSPLGSRSMALSTILDEKEAALRVDTDDADMDGGRVETDVVMAETGHLAPVDEVMPAPQVSETAGCGLADAQRSTAEPSADAGGEQAESEAVGDSVGKLSVVAEASEMINAMPPEPAAVVEPDQQMRADERKPTPEDPTDTRVEMSQGSTPGGATSAMSSLSGANMEEMPPVQSEVLQQSTIPGTGVPPSGPDPAQVMRQPTRSTRSSSKSPSSEHEINGAVATTSSHPMHADLTLEIVSGGGDVSASIEDQGLSKKRSQRAPTATSNAAPARATKRSRTREKKTTQDDDEDDDALFRHSAAAALPPRSGSRKRRQTTEEADTSIGPPPIIENVPPLPFSTRSLRRQSSHSASPTRGAPAGRECEFCQHSVNMSTLLLCTACKRAYHSRCLVKQFKPFWPAEGAIEERLKKLQEQVSDRRASLFRCSSCRATFAEFADTADQYVKEECSCPTCSRPELLATFRRNKLSQMLRIMNEGKAAEKLAPASKASPQSVTSEISAEFGREEAKKETNRPTRESTIDQGADETAKSHGGAARRKSSRPARRRVAGYDETGGDKVEDVAATMDYALAQEEAAYALTKLSLADGNMSQYAPDTAVAKSGVNRKTTKANGPPATETELTMDSSLRCVEFSKHHGSLTFPIVLLRYRVDPSDKSKLANGDPRVFDVSKFPESDIVGRGSCVWVPKKTSIKCSCCDDIMSQGSFASHRKLVASSTDIRLNMLVMHRDNQTCSAFDRFIRAMRWKHKICGSVEGVLKSGASVAEATPPVEVVDDFLSMAIPRKKAVAGAGSAAAPTTAVTIRKPAYIADMINSQYAAAEREIPRDIKAEEAKEAFQRVADVILVKRNRQSKLSQAILDDTDTDADPLDYLVKVVSLDRTYVVDLSGVAFRDRMYELPYDAVSRRVGWLALSASRRFSQSIYCECCDKSMPVAEFMAHSDLREEGKRVVLHVMERVSPSRLQSFAQFCRSVATIARADGDHVFATVLAGLQEFPASPSTAANGAVP